MRSYGLFYADIHNLGNPAGAQGIGRLQIKLQALTNRMHEIANGEKEAKCVREKKEAERKTESAEKKIKGGVIM